MRTYVANISDSKCKTSAFLSNRFSAALFKQSIATSSKINAETGRDKKSEIK